MTDMLSAGSDRLGATPSQTVGPYLSIVLPWDDGPYVVKPGTPGTITILGRVTDGAGAAVPDGLIEVWQADPDGRFRHADDPRGPVIRHGFRGFGRCPTDSDGSFTFHTLKPGSFPDGRGGTEAPHLNISVFARGLLHRLVTRLYFPEESANDEDAVLQSLSEADRALLTAAQLDDSTLRFDIRLQGENETPFFGL